ncbi:hypothetical protein FST71_00390 [Campylobacter jejuni]|nr:hypothetical protein [Campylobacter jejuni]ECL3202167.1 hypothetical protein [Campylobacter jejuni]
MKKAYVLIWTIFLILLISLWMSLTLNISSYTPKIIQDSYYYLQAQIFVGGKIKCNHRKIK